MQSFVVKYSTVLRKPNRYIDDAAARIFPPSKIAPKFDFLVMKHKKRRMLMHGGVKWADFNSEFKLKQ